MGATSDKDLLKKHFWETDGVFKGIHQKIRSHLLKPVTLTLYFDEGPVRDIESFQEKFYAGKQYFIDLAISEGFEIKDIGIHVDNKQYVEIWVDVVFTIKVN